jgi:hypothetical protein
MRERLMLGPTSPRSSPFVDLPDPEARYILDDYQSRSALERWLLDYCPDSDAYTEGRIAVERTATHWRVRFRDQRDGQERAVEVPVQGVPPPPGRAK